jgi:hypothetical protein
VTVVNPGGGASLATLDQRYEPQAPHLALPLCGEAPQVGSSQVTIANQLRAARCIVPHAGFLRDVSVFIQTAGGNVILAAYDTGEAAGTGARTLLGASAQQVVATGWQTWDPGDGVIAVSEGQQLDLACMFDSATPLVGVVTLTLAAAAQLPANFDTVPGGALPKLGWTFAAGSFAAPAAVVEAQCALATKPTFVMARIA